MQTISDLKFVIVGSAASGTGFMHKLLCNCDIPTGHETVFNPFYDDRACIYDDRKDVPDGLVGESSYMALPYVERGLDPSTVVVHVVRDTMAVIRSLVGRKFLVGGPHGTEVYDAWGHAHLPLVVPLLHKPITTAIFYYLRWNERCERVSSYRVRVEDLTTGERVRDLLSVLHVDASDEKIAAAIAATPTNYNSRTRGEVSVEDVMSDTFVVELMNMAERYGYDSLLSGSL